MVQIWIYDNTKHWFNHFYLKYPPEKKGQHHFYFFFLWNKTRIIIIIETFQILNAHIEIEKMRISLLFLIIESWNHFQMISHVFLPLIIVWIRAYLKSDILSDEMLGSTPQTPHCEVVSCRSQKQRDDICTIKKNCGVKQVEFMNFNENTGSIFHIRKKRARKGSNLLASKSHVPSPPPIMWYKSNT